MFAPSLDQAVKDATKVVLSPPIPRQAKAEQLDDLFAGLNRLAEAQREMERTVHEWANRIEESTVTIRESLLGQQDLTPELYTIATAPLVELLEQTSEGAFAEADEIIAKFSSLKKRNSKEAMPAAAKLHIWLANFCIDMGALVRGFEAQLDDGAEITGSFDEMGELANYLRAL